MVTELTAANFEKEVLKSKTPVIVDFWASWCGPCQMMAPVFEETEKAFKGKLKFAKLSTEEYSEISDKYDITGIPCLILFNNGKEAERLVGYREKDQLKRDISNSLIKIK